MRFRMQYSKLGATRFLGHLDLMRLFQRASRRAGLPLAYSAGFNPHPKLALGPALAVGMEGEAEYLDLECSRAIPPEELRERLQEQLPTGIEIRRVKVIDDKEESLTAAVKCAAYRVELAVDAPAAKIKAAVNHLLAQEKIVVKRKGREVDIRRGIYDLRSEDGSSVFFLHMLLACSHHLHVRPAEIVGALGLAVKKMQICRTGLFTSCGPRLTTPLDEFLER